MPNSSPLGSGSSPPPSFRHGGYDGAQAPNGGTSGWGQRNASFVNDPLSAPSGFTLGISASDASFTRPQLSVGHALSTPNSIADASASRKRVRESPGEFTAPESPQVLRPGQRRRVAATTLGLSPSSSDESFSSDPLSRGGRIIRSRPSLDQSTSDQSDVEEQAFKRFQLTMPQHPPYVVRAAWTECGKDVKAATTLLLDEAWIAKLSAPPAPSPRKPPPPKEETGRVQEVVEASQAARQAQREKGKKSMIYQNRPVVDTSFKPAPAQPPTPIRPKAASPVVSPIIAPRRKRQNATIVDSDSDDGYADSDDSRQDNQDHDEDLDEARAFSFFCEAAPEALQELIGCTSEQAEKIVSLRPFDSIDDLKAKLNQGKRKSNPTALTMRMFSDCTAIFAGYGTVDAVLDNCERLGESLKAIVSSWDNSEPDSNLKPMGLDGALSIVAPKSSVALTSKDYLTQQPALLSEGIKLKDYQITGVSWLRLLYRKKLSCILADEMGLGKTCQVISFFASLKEHGNKGPHLIVVPSSTLENWCREFARFAPSISVQTYYAGKEERPLLRQTLTETKRSEHDDGWEVLITTYNLAQGDEKDRKFFRKIDWESCVFDEGHVLKNFQSQRYQALLKYKARWRLLLTGTPLQNNLQELVSLMNFILPDQFADSMESLRAIFKVKGDSKVTMLSEERVSRAKKMMTPFVLRRRKDQVLKDLPKKVERIHWCEMSPLQKSIYTEALQRTRKTVLELDDSATNSDAAPTNGRTGGKGGAKKKGTAKPKGKEKMYAENSSNVLMDLRKAALHPMLFRKRFTDDILTSVTRLLLKEPDFKKRGAVSEYVKEDMQVMTDAELQVFLATYKSTKKYLQDDAIYFDAGKISALLHLLEEYKAQDRRVLIFSQFTQVLDILQAVLNLKQYKYLLLTGATQVDVRQSLVDEFTEDESIFVFLLSTKAGGMGINLTAASVVIMFDQDWNPHADRQAQDRAYRIGQQRDVDVVKLITRDTIEEDMLRLGETKLALDEAVAGDVEDAGASGEGENEKQMKRSLMSALRNQFLAQGSGTVTPKADAEGDIEMKEA